MKILLTGGGTAGHAWPVILVGQSLLKNRRAKILYVGSRQGIEKSLAESYKIPFYPIIVGKRRTYFSWSNFWDIFKIFLGLIQSFFIIIFFRPEVIFVKGGYVTIPIIFWAKVFRKNLVIHESDSKMGRANLWAAKSAQKICLGFPIENYQENIPSNKLVYTGIPVRSEFLQTAISSGERLKILVTGGSQGSAKINNLIEKILPDLLTQYEVWHLSGTRDFEKLKKFQENLFYHLYDFSDLVPKFMRDADLVITRAGASTLMEISATSKPAIVIPLGSAASDHQAKNAEIYFKENAAVVLSEDKLTASSLLAIIRDLMDDKSMRQMLGKNAKKFFQTDSTEKIVEILFEASRC